MFPVKWGGEGVKRRAERSLPELDEALGNGRNSLLGALQRVNR